MEKKPPVIRVIIPVLNEEKAISKVLAALPEGISEIIVVDNGSRDKTVQIAAEFGATIHFEPRKGYGSACLTGIRHLQEDTDIVVFLDGDFSDFPEELPLLLTPILEEDVDLVIGSRTLGISEPGALLPVARFGNALSTLLLYWGFGYRFTDLGPFRAIRFSALKQLQMMDPNFGWTVEMQAKALRHKLKVTEVPVSYRRRIGISKISGTIRGSIKAGFKILWVIGREWVSSKSRGIG